ncbi:MAG TPA: TAT-variant-translocated molybdopterin oxidoreductase, partial [Thermoanaerobaculia bacterium]|nr:TAT-variant-translocated molybdopterin oxidoreductase [Thermoanaerobaculia bacterium]
MKIPAAADGEAMARATGCAEGACGCGGECTCEAAGSTATESTCGCGGACAGETAAPALWRNLDELQGSAAFQEAVENEFPRQAVPLGLGVDRRRFLQLMGGSLALGGAVACTKQPPESIVPYVKQPE